MIIEYISAVSDRAFIQSLLPYFEQQQVQLKPYKKAEKGKAAVIFLFSPLETGTVLTSPEQVWKNYLAKESPNSKFIVAGVEIGKGNNYIDLLQLPKNLKLFVERSKTAKEKWKPVNTGGLDMLKKLERFYKGHGKESLVDTLGAVLTNIEVIKAKLKNIPLENHQSFIKKRISAPSFINEWHVFYSRWKNYFPLFRYLPFYLIMEDLDRKVTLIDFSLNSQVKEKKASKLSIENCQDKLWQVKNKLKKIKRQYVT